ncbi:class I SAM-dependent DNA methyltransferase [Rhodalgimonas zhirmunskyi]|uniref:Methyltransferase domain-containing protein n=1 Tax=Rhodalgimonas zhirmunskyi TaxID=2964767 RepID=A0AAJ1UAA0_9RHOB|nr:class I SAM-dependent methyltransferase [Rhodoalgimonas zhirmunskyi]MDQ2095834.1 methyltransferase domain-containing protein [Rhodoalgimonas zhirmunskyi]
MNTDKHTIAVYDARAAEYDAANSKLYELPELEAFAAALDPGAHVLDLGCGPGFYAEKLAQWGFSVDAVDASAEMIARAAPRPGVTAWQARFEDLDAENLYDGVWANFSLLHASKADFPAHLARIARAGKPGMLLHIGLKMGEGEAVDAIGRFYAYYQEDELTSLLQKAGFTPEKTRFGKGKGLDGALARHIVILARGAA